MKNLDAQIKWLSVFFAVVVSVFIQGSTSRVIADEDEGDLLNYSFAIWLGSGVYQVKDADKRLYVLRVPFSYTFRAAQHDQPALRDKLGFKLLLPALIAYQEETQTDFDYGAGAFVPGFEVQFPANEYWTLKPFGQFGVGKDTSDGDLQYIYGGGARSLVSIPYKDFVFRIGNSVVLAENKNSSTDESNGFSMLEAGLDVQTPLGFNFLSRELNTGLFFVASRFYNRVDFIREDDATERVNLIFTLGLTFEAEEAVSIWKIKFKRVGIDYRWGNAGFRGIGFNMGFPF